MGRRQVIIFKRFIAFGVFALSAVLYSPYLSASEALGLAQEFLDQASAPLFAAADIAPELRFSIIAVEGERPVATMLGEERGEISLAVFRLAETPEEIAAAIARIIGEKETRLPMLDARKGYKIRPRFPSGDRLRGSVTSVDEAIARPGIAAAEDTLNWRGGYGPSVEEIRAHARKLDSYAISLLREAGLRGDSLLRLYEAMAADGASLFERDDFEGRKILLEQISWLRERLDEKDSRKPYWRALDDKLAAIKAEIGF